MNKFFIGQKVAYIDNGIQETGLIIAFNSDLPYPVTVEVDREFLAVERETKIFTYSELTPLEENGYYIQNRGFCGNSLLWWQKGGGYTNNLLKAAVFSEKEALNTCKSRPKEDFPRKISEVLKRVEHHVTNNDWSGE